MILLDRYVTFLVDNDLTQNQLLFLKLIHAKRVDLIKLYKSKFSDNDSMISDYFLKDLIKKEFLIKTDTGYKLGIKFLDIYVDPDTAVDEIFELYPTFMLSSNGVEIPLTAMDRKVFKEIYIPKILGDLKEHREVIKDVQYAIKHKLISVGINKFVTSEHWKAYRKRRVGDLSVKESINKVHDKDF
jgi:hypothetical protein